MKFISLHLDFLGFSASFLCAIHCMAMPFILTFGMISSDAWLTNEWLEWSLIGTTLVIASWSLLRSYRYDHQQKLPLLLAAFGFGMVIFSHGFFIGDIGHGLLAVGGFVIAYAHYRNWLFIRAAKDCKTPIKVGSEVA